MPGVQMVQQQLEFTLDWAGMDVLGWFDINTQEWL